MTPLPQTFTKRITGGAMSYPVQYDQIAREGLVAIFRRTCDGWQDFETINIQENQAGETNLGGKKVTFAARESYPSTGTWGTNGFTFQTEEKARQKMQSIITEKRK